MPKKVIYSLLAVCALLLVFGCQKQVPEEKDLMRVKSTNREKKVILLVVDSLMAQSIDLGIHEKKLPTFQYMIEHGQYYKDVVSSFPTMSVTIDSSLLTGKYPDEHHVPGLTWYSADNKQLINYGTGPMEVLRHGVDSTLADALIHLNRSHLNGKQPTIYDDLARLGYKSGSINGLIYRGQRDHILSIPGWIQGISSLPKKIHVKGPDFMSLGALSNPLEGVVNLPEGPIGRLGLNNSYAIETVNYMVRTKSLPDFLYIYLPDLDQKLHKNGPSEMAGVEETDRQLQALLQSFGSPEKALNEAIFIIVGDSGMSSILPAAQNPVIDLPELLGGADRVLSPGEKGTDKTEYITAVNETMAYVYRLKEERSLTEAVNLIRNDPRIDFIAWKEKDRIKVLQGTTFKQLEFKPNGRFTDRYNQKWMIEQDASVLDIKVNHTDHTLEYGQYPDALMRLSGALHSHDGEYLVVTAKPGYELADKSSPSHKGGGGHGSLHQMESLVPLIISGTDQKPTYLRIVDMKAFLLELVTKQSKGAPLRLKRG